jgi:ATP-dependent exoDNAse (exonuclease V) beta subunit
MAELGGAAPAGPATPPGAAGNAGAARRGTLVHELLEHWTPGTDLDTLAASLVREHGYTLAERRDVANALRAMTDRLAPLGLVQRLHGDPEAVREAPFALRLGDALVAGTIDALLANGEVADWKTGGRRPASHAAYEWQVRLYALALRELRGIEAPRGWLCYVDLGEEVEVDVSAPMLEKTRQRALDAIAAMRAGHHPPADAEAEGERDTGEAS